jgi:hypothetical protein
MQSVLFFMLAVYGMFKAESPSLRAKRSNPGQGFRCCPGSPLRLTPPRDDAERTLFEYVHRRRALRDCPIWEASLLGPAARHPRSGSASRSSPARREADGRTLERDRDEQRKPEGRLASSHFFFVVRRALPWARLSYSGIGGRVNNARRPGKITGSAPDRGGFRALSPLMESKARV